MNHQVHESTKITREFLGDQLVLERVGYFIEKAIKDLKVPDGECCPGIELNGIVISSVGVFVEPQHVFCSSRCESKTLLIVSECSANEPQVGLLGDGLPQLIKVWVIMARVLHL